MSRSSLSLLLPLLLLGISVLSSGSCGSALGTTLPSSNKTAQPSYLSDPEVSAETLAAAALGASPTSAPSLASRRSEGPVDPDAPIGIEDPSGFALKNFFDALKKAETKQQDGRVAIVQFGDSHTAADLGTSRLRRQLQQRFGDAGRGFMIPGRPFKAYYQRDASFASEGKWTVQNGLKRDAIGPFGIAGLRSIASQKTAFAWVGSCEKCPSNQSISRFEVFYRNQPSGGSFQLILDDKPLQEITTDIDKVSKQQKNDPAATATVGAYFGLDVPEGPHKLGVRPLGDGPVDFFGITMERSVPGVVLDALGVNGAQAMHLLNWEWDYVGEQLARRNPSLVILAYGTNEAANPSTKPAKVQEHLELLIQQVRKTVPKASILVVGPPDRNVRERKDCDRPKPKAKKGKKPVVVKSEEPEEVQPGCEWKTENLLIDIIEAQRNAAANQGAAFFDTYLSMGGYGSMHQWAIATPPLAQRDHTHLSKEGYEANADAIFVALMSAYSAYQASTR